MATKQPATPVSNASGAATTAQDLVVAPQAGAVALPADLAAELAGYAKNEAAKERPKVARISLKSGIMSYGGNDMPNNSIEAIIVGGAYRNVFYGGDYDEDNVVNPDCFALSDGDQDEMVPHENVTSPVNPTCKGCANLEWGSTKGGTKHGGTRRGKACKQGRRLMIIPSDGAATAEAVMGAEMAILDLPVTSVPNYAQLVNTVNTTVNLPVWACVVNMQCRPHKRNQFEVIFTPVRGIRDPEVIRAIMKRRDEAMRIALTPYEGTGGEADPEAGKTDPKVAESKAKMKGKF